MKKTNMIKSMLCVGIAFGMVLGSVLSGQAETEEQGKDYEVSLEGAKQYINDKYLLKYIMHSLSEMQIFAVK